MIVQQVSLKNGNICEQCELYCLSCNGLGQCSKYQENLVLYNDQYIKECQIGFRNNERKYVIIIKMKNFKLSNVIIFHIFYIIINLLYYFKSITYFN